MSDTDEGGPRVKRVRLDRGGRSAALEKLKQLKGKKNKCEVSDAVDDVYDMVDEREYASKAKEKYGDDWIDDDGTGYAEDGRDFFEDEGADYSDEDPNQKEKSKGGKKRGRDSHKPLKGKGSIRNLFSNAVPKKTASVSLADDNILADILGELQDEPISNGNEATTVGNVNSRESSKIIAPAKIMRRSTKNADAALAKEYMNSFINNIKVKENTEKKCEDDELLERILQTKPTKKPQPETQCIKEASPAKSPKRANSKTAEEEIVTVDAFEEFPNDDIDFASIQTAEERPKVVTESAKTVVEKTSRTEEPELDLNKLLGNWEQICQMDRFEEEVDENSATTVDVGDTDTSTDVAQNLKFWYWEAYEDANKLPGQVYLFGKTTDGKSISVRVENVNHVLYLLPREYLLDNISKEPTEQKVTLADMYKEFDEDIAVQLKLNGFRSRKATKNFAYHSIGIDVPQVCDYMEVHYDGKKPAPNIHKKYNSIAHIFGAHTSPLERFLLDRKIKGPCWLILKQFDINSVPSTWCKMEVTVNEPKFVLLCEEPKPAPPPPLTILTLNVRTALNSKTLKNEICMISMLVHNRFHIDKPAPQPAFNRHMCGITRPTHNIWPFDLNAKLAQFKATRIHKHDSERALLGWFLAQYQQIDADLIITYDALDCQLNVLVDRTIGCKIPQWSRLGRLRLSQQMGKKLLDFFTGRIVCDVKRSAEECIRARAYDLQTLCQQVLHVKDTERMDVNDEELLSMYETGDGILKLISLTMQDAAYMLRLMCELNIMPLALQITNICGNTMTRTLQGGRSERNEFLLLHAFTEKNYIVPDKRRREWLHNKDGESDVLQSSASTARKKAAYAGGLVLEPIRGLYDKYVLLMDFNSLYPSIIQEYNICFSTIPQPYNLEDLPPLPESSVEQGILPQQLRRLVESRREVKKLMAQPDLPPEQQMQYHIRQMALKLTANSMYGCLGFSQSRFYAQHLAALVTHKGREILMNTKSMVQKMNYEVVYGDTDSIMVNTNINEYDQVFKIGHSIKQAVNKMYKQLEIDIDGVFSMLLLLKKKKYAAVKVSKNAKGELKKEQEHKGLDIVRRDWSQLAVMVGKVVLEEVLSEKQLDEKLEAFHAHLEKIRDQVQENVVPLAMYVITKQLSKAPAEFNNASSQAHVQVALRMNAAHKRRYKKGDMVDYIICDDGTKNPATQRAYHLDELKSNEKLRVDSQYYLAHQIHPVVTRMVDVLEGTDASRIAECLGLDPTKFRAAAQRAQEARSEDTTGESLVKTTLQKYRDCEKFKFTCVACKTENLVATAFRPAMVATTHSSHEAALQKCCNIECSTAPYQYVLSIRNQLILAMRKCIQRFYQNWLVCDEPACNYNTRAYSHVTVNDRPVCAQCQRGSLLRQYTERDLHQQLCYWQYIFDLTHQQHKKITLTPEVEAAYQMLRETVEQQIEKSAYCTISLSKLFVNFKPLALSDEITGHKIDLTIDPTNTNTNVAVTLKDVKDI